MPAHPLQRTVRRIGATVTLLLALLVLYVRELYARQWVGDVVPAPISSGVPVLVVLVSLAYLTLSLLRGFAVRMEASAPADTSDESTDG